MHHETNHIQVDAIFLHPKYRLRSLVNDIALVRLSTKAKFNNYVQPICVWLTNETDLSNVVGKYGMVIGWGLTEMGNRSDILQQASMPVVPFHTCLESNRNAFRDYLSDTTFCAGSRNGTSVCFGDSGGSMFFERNDVYFIRGIVSATPTKIYETNKKECDSMQYALFTDVSQYVSWIENVTKCEMGPRCVSKLENKLVRVTKYEIRVAPVQSSKLPIDSIRKKRQISAGIEPVMANSDPQTHHWPWHAAIYELNESVASYRCGGTVISASSILTAGHCVSSFNVPMDTERLSVSLGKLNLDVNESTAQNFDVAEITMHPQFSSIDLNNDIAILRLSTHATFTNYVQPICLWPSNKKKLSNVAGKAGMVIGWGLTEMGVRSNVLRQAFVPVEVDSRKCLPTNRGLLSLYMWEANYCAGSRNGTGVCFGDSGGSMTFVENGVAYIRGIVSVIPGKPNKTAVTATICDSYHYALFTDVALYLSWIERATIESQKNVQCM
ncbi:transmembrane protease serine 9-like [Bradysia coprophila]|uniref:transmembrane protease serine 9-like n=1 Tax=Bradysia coprophila TaxID=38358 RepID=UPI00187D9ECA|nr:transmembrane protease serine 9-like [Bradysia coprophila]